MPLPMFPLGTVLVPHMVLPLHIFEERYRALIRDVLDGDGQFGVVLIERGHEVGGGDVRTDLGTVARVLKAEELDDGRWVAVAVGTQRLKVERWLADEPYPRAEVRLLDDPPAGAEAAGRCATVQARLRRVLGLLAELDDPAPATAAIELDPDPLVASYQAVALAPLGPLDAQRLLAAPTADERLRLLETMLEDAAATLEFRLSG